MFENREEIFNAQKGILNHYCHCIRSNANDYKHSVNNSVVRLSTKFNFLFMCDSFNTNGDKFNDCHLDKEKYGQIRMNFLYDSNKIIIIHLLCNLLEIEMTTSLGW